MKDSVQTRTAKKAMLEALKSSLGIVSTAANTAGVGRQTHYDWLEKDKAYKKSVDKLDDIALDFGESKLHELMNGIKVEGANGVYKTAPNPASVIFFLKTRGKRRGYIEKSELEIQTPPEINITYEK